MNSLMERLQQKPTDLESRGIFQAMVMLEELRQKTEALTLEQWQEGMVRLAPYRLKSSGTLKRGRVESWQRANIFVAEKIQAGAQPTWKDVLKINALLQGEESVTIREEAIYISSREAFPVDQLSAAIEVFTSEILTISNHENPFVAAALCQFWLVSLHPFTDANGRTAVLLADWILGLHGYLPLSFATKLDAMIAVLSDERESATPAGAILKLLNNIQQSYRVVLGLGLGQA